MPATTTLHSTGTNTASGTLEGPIVYTVQTWRMDSWRLAVSVWDGPHRIAEGMVYEKNNTWKGVVGRWIVTGKPPHLTFTECAGHSASTSAVHSDGRNLAEG